MRRDMCFCMPPQRVTMSTSMVKCDMFRTPDGEQLDGIIYPSSKHRSEPAVVLFADNGACVEENGERDSDALLVLTGYGTTELNSLSI
ncbi:hypothetical protein E0L29_11290 [Chlorobium sp. N1]|nr:hypothetical protein E0L29_11290 [Chlorobium sp. N1]